MGKSKTEKTIGKSQHSQSTPQLISHQEPIEAYATATDVSTIDRHIVSSGGQGQVNINVNINHGQPDGFAAGGVVSQSGFGGAAPLNYTHTETNKNGEQAIIEVARSPTHKKRRGNKVENQNIETEYTVPGGLNKKAMKEYLTQNNWPDGLQKALIDTCK
jgi:hypothetical protein